MNFYFFIQLVVEAEQKLEEIRIQLANLDNFEPFTTYKRLDQPRTGGLKSENVFEFLNDNDIQVTQDQLDYIFRVLDEDSDGIVTYQDFKSAILPKMNDQVKDQALSHKGYDLPVDMYLPKEIETQLSQFFIQIKQNYLQYQQIQQKIDLNQLDIYDNDNQITVDSLKDWLQQQEKEISEEILQDFIIIIQGQPLLLQKLLDLIYTENQEDQDQNDWQEEEENINQQQQQEEQENFNQQQQEEEEENANQEQYQEEEENVNQEQYQEDQEQIQQEEDLEQDQQNDIEADQDLKDNQQNNQQEVNYQEQDHNYMDNYNLNHYDIELEISLLKKKIQELEILLEIPSSFNNRSYIGQIYDGKNNRELQKFSRISYLNTYDKLPSQYSNNLIREKLWIDEEIQREEIKCKNILAQLNQTTLNRSSSISDRYYNQIYYSPVNLSKSRYISEYSGYKYSDSTRKPNLNFQKSINFSIKKF